MSLKASATRNLLAWQVPLWIRVRYADKAHWRWSGKLPLGSAGSLNQRPPLGSAGGLIKVFKNLNFGLYRVSSVFIRLSLGPLRKLDSLLGVR